jgi:hypothetical protein
MIGSDDVEGQKDGKQEPCDTRACNPASENRRVKPGERVEKHERRSAI